MNNVINIAPREWKKEKNYAIAYIDLLGTTERIKQDHNSHHLNLLYTILNFAVLPLENDIFSKSRYSKIVTKVFSDNIVLAIPFDSDEPIQELVCLLKYVASFQYFANLSYHWLIRGGITVGPLYIDSLMVWGKGLIRAYNLENEIAIYPRIVVDSTIVKEYSIIKDKDLVRMDFDGQFFLNFLDFVQHCDQNENDNFGVIAKMSYKELLLSITDSNGRKVEKPYQKLLWFKSYLNAWYQGKYPNESLLLDEEE